MSDTAGLERGSRGVGIERLDHLVLTVTDLERTIAFYCGALGMSLVRFGRGRLALGFGQSKINLHEAGREFEPKARIALPGTADLCFTTPMPMEAVVDRLAAAGVAVELGPVRRTGARATLLSVYVRDPDGNLVEIANEIEGVVDEE